MDPDYSFSAELYDSARGSLCVCASLMAITSTSGLVVTAEVKIIPIMIFAETGFGLI